MLLVELFPYDPYPELVFIVFVPGALGGRGGAPDPGVRLFDAKLLPPLPLLRNEFL